MASALRSAHAAPRCRKARQEDGMTARKIWVVLAGALWLCLLGVIASVAVGPLRVGHKRTAAPVEEADNDRAQAAVGVEGPWEAPLRGVGGGVARGDRASAEAGSEKDTAGLQT